MEKENILDLIGYNYWAWDIVLDAASQVPSAQFIAHVNPDPGRGSLRGILVHALDTEIGWRQIVQKLEMAPDLVDEDYPDAVALRTPWAAERERWFSFCQGLDHQALNAPYTYQASSGATRTRLVWQTIFHVVNHSTQHRSEAAYLLTGYGRSPGDIDFNFYLHTLS